MLALVVASSQVLCSLVPQVAVLQVASCSFYFLLVGKRLNLSQLKVSVDFWVLLSLFSTKILGAISR